MKNKSYAPFGVKTLVPTVNITVNNNRLKRYNKQNPQPNYYLKDGQEFQLELFNPTTDIVKADISLNNVKIPGGGLVLKPGERVFLDRYLDSPKKFKFETYEVGNSEEVKKAIEKNGLVKVEFYQQDLRTGFHGGTWTTQQYPWDQNQQWQSPNIFYTNGINDTSSGIVHATTTSFNSNDVTYTSNLSNISSERQLLTDSPDVLRGHLSKGGKTNAPSTRHTKKVETGRVGEGSNSNQSFKYVDYKFFTSSFHTSEYQILPLSTKQTTTSDLNVKRYCTECGTKYSKGSKYCSNCGNKL
jgi:hypothetical protein